MPVEIGGWAGGSVGGRLMRSIVGTNGGTVSDMPMECAISARSGHCCNCGKLCCSSGRMRFASSCSSRVGLSCSSVVNVEMNSVWVIYCGIRIGKDMYEEITLAVPEAVPCSRLLFALALLLVALLLRLLLLLLVGLVWSSVLCPLSLILGALDPVLALLAWFAKCCCA